MLAAIYAYYHNFCNEFLSSAKSVLPDANVTATLRRDSFG